MAKDDVSIRITFSERGEDKALEMIKFIEDNFNNISFQKPRFGSNPKYLPGGKNFDKEQGKFKLSYSRLSVKNFTPQLPINKNK